MLYNADVYMFTIYWRMIRCLCIYNGINIIIVEAQKLSLLQQ